MFQFGILFLSRHYAVHVRWVGLGTDNTWLRKTSCYGLKILVLVAQTRLKVSPGSVNTAGDVYFEEICTSTEATKHGFEVKP